MRNQRPPPTIDPPKEPTKYTLCPNCASPDAIVAATHYSSFACFCPACDHAWDCDAPG
jgi:hypothetical protein